MFDNYNDNDFIFSLQQINFSFSNYAIYDYGIKE